MSKTVIERSPFSHSLKSKVIELLKGLGKAMILTEF